MPTPVSTDAVRTVTHRDGTLSESGGTTVYRDGAGFETALPPGFTGSLTIALDASGPPASGKLRLRVRDAGDPACVIDLALEEPLADSEPAMREGIARGREVFFVARSDEPQPQLPSLGVWTATLVPADPSRVDVGYWVRTESHTLRAEGRFPVVRLPACKDALDAMVRGLRVPGVAVR